MAISRCWPQRARSPVRRWGQRPIPSPIAILTRLPLYRDACWIADLDPDRARAGSIGAVNLLGRNAPGAKPASMREHGKAVFGDVFIEQDASLDISQQPHQRGLAVEEW